MDHHRKNHQARKTSRLSIFASTKSLKTGCLLHQLSTMAVLVRVFPKRHKYQTSINDQYKSTYSALFATMTFRPWHLVMCSSLKTNLRFFSGRPSDFADVFWFEGYSRYSVGVIPCLKKAVMKTSWTILFRQDLLSIMQVVFYDLAWVSLRLSALNFRRGKKYGTLGNHQVTK